MRRKILKEICIYVGTFALIRNQEEIYFILYYTRTFWINVGDYIRTNACWQNIIIKMNNA